MLTREMIEITFGNALAQANQLDNCAETLESMSQNNLTSVREDILFAWEGEAARAYVSKMDITRDNMQKTARNLRDIAETLRRVARIFRDSELKAIEIAANRTYVNS